MRIYAKFLNCCSSKLQLFKYHYLRVDICVFIQGISIVHVLICICMFIKQAKYILICNK